MKTTCPNEEKLACYLEGSLSDHDRAVMESHLSECEICLDNLMVTRSIVRGGTLSLDEVPARVTQSAVRLAKRHIGLANDSLAHILKRPFKNLWPALLNFFDPASWAERCLAPIRSSRKLVSRNIVHVRKSFKDIDPDIDIDIDIEIEKTKGEKAHIRVNLLDCNRFNESIRVTLKKGERELSSYLLGKENTLFEDVPFGRYSLTFSKNGAVLGKYLFKIKESPDE